MLSLLLAALLQPAIEPGPDLPPGTSAEFQSLAISVQRALFDEKFAEAEALARKLPEWNPKIQLDLGQAPESRHAEFQKATQAAFEKFSRVMANFQPSIAGSGEIHVSFSKDLGVDPDTKRPRGAAFFVSTDSAEPRVDAIIGLKRGVDQLEIEANEVANEIAYAIGLYLGLGEVPPLVGIMGRVDEPTMSTLMLSRAEAAAMQGTLAAAVKLREAVAKKVRLEPHAPDLFVSPDRLEAPSMLESEVARWTLQLTNRGSGVLRYTAQGDCGCVGARGSGELAAGASGLVEVAIDTTGFPGKFEKNVYIYSNDPTRPLWIVPIQSSVRPLYRFLPEGGSNKVSLHTGSTKYVVYLVLDEEYPLKIEKVEVAGVNVEPQVTPWEGDLADPELGEPAKPRKGLRIEVDVPEKALPPAAIATFTIAAATDHPIFKTITHTVTLQRGIQPSPQRVFFGQVGSERARAWFNLTRPGRSFKVLKVESDTDSFSARLVPAGKFADARVVVEYDGKALPGTLKGSILVHTDDPDQPIVQVPVQAFVK